MSDLLLGLAVHARTLTPVAGRLAENLTTLLVCIDGALDACHRIYSLCPSGVLRARLGVQRGRPPCSVCSAGGSGALAERLLGLRGVARRQHHVAIEASGAGA